jgi:hypothetical protein
MAVAPFGVLRGGVLDTGRIGGFTVNEDEELLVIAGLVFLVLSCILGFILVLSLGTTIAMGITIATSWCVGMAVICFRVKHRLGKERKEQGKVKNEQLL